MLPNFSLNARGLGLFMDSNGLGFLFFEKYFSLLQQRRVNIRIGGVI